MIQRLIVLVLLAAGAAAAQGLEIRALGAPAASGRDLLVQYRCPSAGSGWVVTLLGAGPGRTPLAGAVSVPLRPPLTVVGLSPVVRGRAWWRCRLPRDPRFAGLPLYLAGVVWSAGGVHASPCLALTIRQEDWPLP